MNKIERVKAVFRNETPDITPAGFWFHYSGSLSPAEMAESHLELYRKTDMDVIKIMQDYPYPLDGEVKTVSDWAKLRMPGTSSPAYQKLEEVLKRILDAVGGEVMLFQTMFGAFKTAVSAFGDELVMAHAKENPKAVAAGVKVIAETLVEWANAYLDAGASGIYYSAQFGEIGRFTDAEWAELVRPSDLSVLNVAGGRDGCYNILHICGEPDYQFRTHVERFVDYPGDIVNWSVKDNDFSLEKGGKLYKRAVLGGMNNKGNILSGGDDAITDEVRGLIGAYGQKGLMIGADCTIQGKGISLDRIRVAVEAAHGYVK